MFRPQHSRTCLKARPLHPLLNTPTHPTHICVHSHQHFPHWWWRPSLAPASSPPCSTHHHPHHLQALPAYETASTLSRMSQEIVSKVRELKKKVKKQQQVSIGMHLATTSDASGHARQSTQQPNAGGPRGWGVELATWQPLCFALHVWRAAMARPQPASSSRICLPPWQAVAVNHSRGQCQQHDCCSYHSLLAVISHILPVLLSIIVVLQQAGQARSETASNPPWLNVGRPQPVPEGGVSPPGPAAWAQGLKPDKQAEWLVDCYRMRLDDDYVYGGGRGCCTIEQVMCAFCFGCQHTAVPTAIDRTRAVHSTHIVKSVSASRFG